MKIENLGVREDKKLLIWHYNKVKGLIASVSSSTVASDVSQLQTDVGNINTALTQMSGNVTTLQTNLPYKIVVLTETEYNALSEVDNDTLYFIKQWV